MAKKITFVATFPCGGTLTRSSATKVYTHAWRVLDALGAVYASGFSTTEHRAYKNAHAITSSHRNAVKYTIQLAPAVAQDPNVKPAVLPWRIEKTYRCRVGTEMHEHKSFVTAQANAHLRFATFEEANKMAIRFALAAQVRRGETIAYHPVENASKKRCRK